MNRLSEVDLSWLGFKLHTRVEEGGQNHVANVTFLQFQQLKAYCDAYYPEPRVKLTYLNTSNELFIKFVEEAHEAASRALTGGISVFNHALTGSWRGPLLLRGSAELLLNDGSRCLPDEQVMSIHDRSPNLVAEVHNKSDSSIVAFNRLGRSYIQYTNDVLVVLLMKIYEQGSMIIAKIVRDVRPGAVPNMMNCTDLISFGITSPVTSSTDAWLGELNATINATNAANAANAAFVAANGLPALAAIPHVAMTGVGHGGPPCNGSGIPAYLLPIEGYRILETQHVGLGTPNLTRFRAPILAAINAGGPLPDYVIDLYEVRSYVWGD